MLMRMMGVILFTLIIGGCTTGAKKQATQISGYQKPSQTYQQKTPSWEHEDFQPTESYEQPVKITTYSAPIELSVKQIQKALKSAGFYQGSIDGKIGSKTREAIIKFQKVNGLKADGIVGKRTSAELNKYLSR